MTPRLLHAVEREPRDPLTEEVSIFLGTLAFLAEAAERLADNAAELGELPPFLRGEARQLSVAIQANVTAWRPMIDKLTKKDRKP